MGLLVHRAAEAETAPEKCQERQKGRRNTAGQTNETRHQKSGLQIRQRKERNLRQGPSELQPTMSQGTPKPATEKRSKAKKRGSEKKVQKNRLTKRFLKGQKVEKSLATKDSRSGKKKKTQQQARSTSNSHVGPGRQREKRGKLNGKNRPIGK